MAVAIVLSPLLCAPAWGFDDDAIDFSLIAADRYDSNLFRLPDGSVPSADNRRSATTRTEGIGLAIDKTYGSQHFQISANQTRVSYMPFNDLDTRSKLINAAWAWTLTPEITGNIVISRVQSPNNFSDTGVQSGPNERKTEDRRFDLDWKPGAALHPQLSLLTDEDKSQQPTIDRQNSSTRSVEGALIYEFHSGNTAEIYFRRGRGNYTNIDIDPTLQNDSQFNEHETGVGAHYRSTGFSSFDGRLGYLSREHETFASRNFGGLVGQLSYTYLATGKTQIQLQASRSLYSAQSFQSSYTVDETLSLNPTWNATSKISVRPSYAITRRTFDGAIVPIAQNLVMTLRDIDLAIDWNVYRGVTLTLQLIKENRSSNDSTYQFSDRGGSLQASIRF
jgi:exopolysaccharide biosynthesis operon protein EpsL